MQRSGLGVGVSVCRIVYDIKDVQILSWFNSVEQIQVVGALL